MTVSEIDTNGSGKIMVHFMYVFIEKRSMHEPVSIERAYLHYEKAKSNLQYKCVESWNFTILQFIVCHQTEQVNLKYMDHVIRINLIKDCCQLLYCDLGIMIFDIR